MKVGDLVTLSAKAKQLAWLEQVVGTDKKTLLHGVIVNKRALPFKLIIKVTGSMKTEPVIVHR